MQILGHSLIEFLPLKSISSISEFEKNIDKNIFLFEYEPELIKYAKEKNLEFALHIYNETEAVIGNCIGAKILICSEKIATSIQNIAEYYLFDSKIAILINNESQIQLAIDKKVDMAILPGAII